MFAYIKGSLEQKSNNYVVIDVGGIGYKIFMATKAIETLGEIGKVVKVHTHYYVREDNISLYGFNTNEELRMFELLLQVSGIGAKSAIAMLSEISPSSFALAVISDDISQLVKIPGIGKKTAARIVLELKDKLKTEEAITKTEEVKLSITNEEETSEAIAALQVLGYTKREIEKALENVDTKNLQLEEIIKQGLKNLARN
ncbi:MAG: Holliday junction branch migration protein RuvA [Clostridia bacterium]|jgi:holliday junction DNA helicase ruvA|nr:Holliday junction branch migration protein RuvA [Clostridia bacterium]CDD27692.1 holliday junction ATP-dependent DNA helicase RuvA [Clostridium sp. CAG:452]HJJ03207.1 Holliday junction branch migration protein RuvA [Clostridiaceae bacterium]